MAKSMGWSRWMQERPSTPDGKQNHAAVGEYAPPGGRADRRGEQEDHQQEYAVPAISLARPPAILRLHSHGSSHADNTPSGCSRGRVYAEIDVR